MTITGVIGVNIVVVAGTEESVTYSTGHVNVTEDSQGLAATKLTAEWQPMLNAVGPTCTNVTRSIQICSHVCQVSRT